MPNIISSYEKLQIFEISYQSTKVTREQYDYLFMFRDLESFEFRTRHLQKFINLH